ncbi:glutaredoxin-1-like [Glandiceps talaboti]
MASSSKTGRYYARKFVDAAISENHLVVFSMPYCPYTRKAIGILQTFKLKDPVTEVSIHDRKDMVEVQEYFKELTGGNTVPRIFLRGEFIGGCSDIENMAEDSKLEDLLREKKMIK